MSEVLGNNVAVALFIEGEGYIPIFCAKTAEMVKTFDEIEATTVTSPNAREYRPGLSNTTVTVSGVTTIANDTQKISWFYLNQLGDVRDLVQLQMSWVDEDGNVIGLRFDAMIRDLSISGNMNEWSQSSVTMRVSGAMTPTETLDPPVVPEFNELSDWWETVADQSFVAVGSVTSGRYNYTLTDDDIVLEVDREGTQHDEVTGTPGNRQYRWNTSLVRIEVDPANPFVSGERIFVLFKRPL